MTSGELVHPVVDDGAAQDSVPAEGESGANGPSTSTADRKQPDVVAQATAAFANLIRNEPGGPTGASVSGARAQAVSSPGAPAPMPNGVIAPVPNGVQPPAPGAEVAPPDAAVPPPDGAAPPGGTTTPPDGAPRDAASEPPGIDPEMIAAIAPTALMAGSMAMMALPMLASALAGLAGGGSSGGSGSPASAPSGAGLSPEAQNAVNALNKLADTYGEDGTESGTGRVGSTPGRVSGSGAGATAIRAKALYQKNAAKAFNNLDNDLARYMTSLAGANKADRTAILRLIRDVNVQLAELGPNAYTKSGQRKVHEILTTALQKAQAIVHGGQARASETAAMVNRLTAQYLNGIAGKHTSGAGVVQPGNGRPRSPLDPGTYRISSHFGPRNGKHHGGLDLAAPAGTPIYAVTGGTVVKAGNAGDGYGYQVRIRSADGTETIYAHQTPGSIRVRPGQQIPAGTVIGAVGSTGNSTGNHLHYEVRRNGRAIEPRAYLAANGVHV
ncbi:peptidoglycan DD-metalloendopeptidase family protein [Nocardia sp. NPDC049220]|uniref:peptidoglycan DD-metalloendopeptidase family protein n=1 Tax=Nocardia sp. NPDC049220 TaxID=3155273 RepID=UPI0033C7DEE3